MNINSTTAKLFAYACCAAMGAFVVGLCLIRTIKHFDSLYVIGLVLSGAFLMFVLYWTRRVARRLAASETARKSASTFLWSCIIFSMISSSLGIQVSGYVWYGSDFIRRFGVVFWSGITGIAIYPVLRDAKRLADAAGPSQNPSR